MKAIPGSCLCGGVKFECDNTFEEFFYCHCKQCQKVTGSAHASNLYTSPDNIVWTAGIELIRRYDMPNRIISSSFCNICGSPVPYVSKSGKALVVPVGTLEGTPNITPSANIFWAERNSWYEDGLMAEKFESFAD